jgi:hypothetical protein
MGTAVGMAGDHMRQKNAAQVYHQLLCLNTVGISSVAGDTAVTTDQKQVDALKEQIVSLQHQILDGEQPRWEVVAEFVGLIGDVLAHLCMPSVNIPVDGLYEWLWLGGEWQCNTSADAEQLTGINFVGLKVSSNQDPPKCSKLPHICSLSCACHFHTIHSSFSYAMEMHCH